jgi:hypothetical protein
MNPTFPPRPDQDEFDLSFKVFHELMARKVTDILLVSSPYEAFIMEEEGRLAERIIHEYRGLNLSRPPMLTWASTSAEALSALRQKRFDLVITMPLVDDTDAYALGRTIKDSFPELPVFLLVHKTGRQVLDPTAADRSAIDRVYVWQGNSDLLLALIKNLEDRLNVAHDTERAKVRVIILVEDSPLHYSALLPILYKQIVSQTQAAMEEWWPKPTRRPWSSAGATNPICWGCSPTCASRAAAGWRRAPGSPCLRPYAPKTPTCPCSS